MTVKTIEFDGFLDANGTLVPIEFDSLPFVPKRIFYVKTETSGKEIRGQHAHYETEQLLFCLNGNITVWYQDKNENRSIELSNNGVGLYLPAMTWAEQEYEKGSILLVLASTKYDAKDYITDFEDFKKAII